MENDRSNPIMKGDAPSNRANGVMKYDISGASEIKIGRGEGMPGRHEVLEDMDAALRHGARPVHNGRWGKATVEVALAILQSAREQREIALHHQVAAPVEHT